MLSNVQGDLHGKKLCNSSDFHRAGGLDVAQTPEKFGGIAPRRAGKYEASTRNATPKATTTPVVRSA
jgi:hypothetical protein